MNGLVGNSGSKIISHDTTSPKDPKYTGPVLYPAPDDFDSQSGTLTEAKAQELEARQDQLVNPGDAFGVDMARAADALSQKIDVYQQAVIRTDGEDAGGQPTGEIPAKDSGLKDPPTPLNDRSGGGGGPIGPKPGSDNPVASQTSAGSETVAEDDVPPPTSPGRGSR